MKALAGVTGEVADEAIASGGGGLLKSLGALLELVDLSEEADEERFFL